MEPIPQHEFEAIVSDALDQLPPDLGQLIDNVVVLVEDRHPTEDLLGLYEGIPLTERSDYGDMVLPDRITLYRLALCEDAKDLAELTDEIAITTVHEIAHHFGIDDDRLHELGWG